MSSIHVVLVHPEIHWNTGNAGRTCLAAGATLHLVEPLGFRLDEKEVKRAGLDYWPHVDLRVWPSWSAFEAELAPLEGWSMIISSALCLANAQAPAQLFIWPAAAWDNFFIGCHSRSFNGHFRHSWITFSPV